MTMMMQGAKTDVVVREEREEDFHHLPRLRQRVTLLPVYTHEGGGRRKAMAIVPSFLSLLLHG